MAAVALVAVSLSIQANDRSVNESENAFGPSEPRRIAAWGATPEIPQVAPANSSVRNIALISVTGTEVRMRVANPRSGSTLLVIGSASIALQQGQLGADVMPGSITVLPFDGNPGITIPPSTESVYSDPMPFAVEAN